MLATRGVALYLKQLRNNGIHRKKTIDLTLHEKQEIVFAGGGYFRLFPYWLIKRWTSLSAYNMSYLHPRDFDANQPVIEGLSAFRRFKSYVGLSKSELKLEKWLHDFDFIDLEQAVTMTVWAHVRRVRL